MFDFVLLDCPAGIEQGFRNAIAGADKALVVTTPEDLQSVMQTVSLDFLKRKISGISI